MTASAFGEATDFIWLENEERNLALHYITHEMTVKLINFFADFL